MIYGGTTDAAIVVYHMVCFSVFRAALRIRWDKYVYLVDTSVHATDFLTSTRSMWVRSISDYNAKLLSESEVKASHELGDGAWAGAAVAGTVSMPPVYGGGLPMVPVDGVGLLMAE